MKICTQEEFDSIRNMLKTINAHKVSEDTGINPATIYKIRSDKTSCDDVNYSTLNHLKLYLEKTFKIL